MLYRSIENLDFLTQIELSIYYDNDVIFLMKNNFLKNNKNI